MSKTLSYPITRRTPVTKTVGGVTFEDPYAWLHEESEEARDWMWKQDAIAQNCAQSCESYTRLKQRLIDTPEAISALFYGHRRLVGGKWFFMDASPTGDGQALFVADGPARPGRLLFDAGAFARSAGDGRIRSFHFWEPSPDAAFLACTLFTGGDMMGVWRVIDVARRKLLPIEIPAIGFAGVIPGWLPDGNGFYLQDRSPEGHHRVRFIPIRRGVKPKPDVVLGPDLVPPIVPGFSPQVSPRGRWAIGVSTPHEHTAYVIGDLRTGTWRRFLPEGFTGECDGAWLDDKTYVARVHDAPRGRVVAIPVATSTDKTTWRELVPPSDAVMRAVTLVEKRIAISELKDVSVRFRLVNLDGTPDRILPFDDFGSSRIASLVRRFEKSDALVVDYETFTQATTRYHYDVGKGRLTRIGPEGKKLEGITVKQRFATSQDGARVPYFIVYRQDLDLSAPKPALVEGYGGFNVVYGPSFLRTAGPFVEAGGVYVHTCLRGGAEYGPEWHNAGRLRNKQRTFDDLFAIAEDLIAAGITKPDLLAMTGASNGGLLAGVAIAQRPDLWRVVVPDVPIFDQMEPLRTGPEHAAILSFFLQEYGDPRDPAMARVLYAYSPYHLIKDGTAYPAVFQVFGENDLGCLPFHGRKFTARLQAATTSGRPILLRVWKDTAHGTVGEKAAAQVAEWLGFVMQELGMRY